MIWTALAEFGFGLVLVVYFAGRLRGATTGIALRLGMSERITAAVFTGFMPGHLAVGLAAALSGESAIAFGVIVGGAMVGVTLYPAILVLTGRVGALGISSWVTGVAVASMLLGGGLGVNGVLSRRDGAILLTVFIVVALLRATWLRRSADMPDRRLSHLPPDTVSGRLLWSVFGASLVGLALGALLVVAGSMALMPRTGVSGMVLGMALLPLLLHGERLARAAGSPGGAQASGGLAEVLGIPVASFLFNAGLIALTAPVLVGPDELMFYLPLCLLGGVAISLFALGRSVPRWGGAVLLFLYAVFFGGGFAGWW